MPDCTSCGTSATDQARFCAVCGRAMEGAGDPQATTTHEASALGLDDVPWWISWLVPAISWATFGFGLILYPISTYRRGRRDGVGREPTEEPYNNLGWPTVGWALAHCVPVLSWYAGIHLPTMWYKHGLRVGARDRTAPKGFTSLPALLAPLPVVAFLVFLMFVGVLIAVQPAEGTANP